MFIDDSDASSPLGKVLELTLPKKEMKKSEAKKIEVE